MRQPPRPSTLMSAMRQLAVAGLPGKAGWLASLPILRQLMPSDQDVLFWFDDAHVITDVQVGSAEAASCAAIYLRNFATSADWEAGPTYSEFVASRRPVDHMSEHDGYRTSGLHRQVFAPLGIEHLIRFSVRPAGLPPVCFTFGRSHRSFTDREVARILNVRPLLEHILAGVGTLPRNEPMGSGDSELLLADESGCIHYATSKAIYLIHRAAGLGVHSGTLADPAYRAIRPVLRELAHQVTDLELGRDASLPSRVFHQPDGAYAFRAYRLDGISGGRLVAVQIQHRLPLMVRLFAAGRLQSLPAREQQIVLLLLEGRSVTDIAANLALTANTVGSYIRNLYARLDIHRREELRHALLERRRPSRKSRAASRGEVRPNAG